MDVKRVRRGPDTPLRPEAVIESALTLADSEGLDAVTIRRLADEHGVTPMALYRHFRDKDDLLEKIADRVLSEMKLPEKIETDSAVELKGLMTSFLDAIRPHPSIATLIGAQLLQSEQGLELSERFLSRLVKDGLSNESAASVGIYAISSMLTLVSNEPGMGRYSDLENRDDVLRAKRAALASLSPRRFPTVIACADALTDCENENDYFDLGLELIVKGIKGITLSL
jgi:AcrR family transcriptional regulator